jgi:catechol 2,3-dioxygenase-like lactoylglutathione lyase family enzyme
MPPAIGRDGELAQAPPAHALGACQPGDLWLLMPRRVLYDGRLRRPCENGATPMKIQLHHINLCSSNVSAMEAFYRTVLDLQPAPGLNENRTPEGGYPGKVAFVTDGTTQLHLAEKDFAVSFRTGQAINPVERGHIAFRTDDMEAFKRRLKEQGIRYADFGTWAMKGWEQIFFYDPDGNIIEVHQVRG